MNVPVIYRLACKAQDIAATLGTQRAAGFLRNRQVPLSAALLILLGQTQVRA